MLSFMPVVVACLHNAKEINHLCWFDISQNNASRINKASAITPQVISNFIQKSKKSFFNLLFFFSLAPQSLNNR